MNFFNDYDNEFKLTDNNDIIYCIPMHHALFDEYLYGHFGNNPINSLDFVKHSFFCLTLHVFLQFQLILYV